MVLSAKCVPPQKELTCACKVNFFKCQESVFACVHQDLSMCGLGQCMFDNLTAACLPPRCYNKWTSWFLCELRVVTVKQFVFCSFSTPRDFFNHSQTTGTIVSSCDCTELRSCDFWLPSLGYLVFFSCYTGANLSLVETLHIFYTEEYFS